MLTYNVEVDVEEWKLRSASKYTLNASGGDHLASLLPRAFSSA
jgi:hypothetical protein